jgi:pyruvate formate lyase activating enzyme
LIGKRVTVDDVFDEVSKDSVFYEMSRGGVTASGGEPTLQPDFVRELFAKCRSAGIDTALDTCGYVNWKNLNEILGYTDLVLYDFKLMTKEQHRMYTGVEPELIWENAQKIAKIGKPMWVRTPVIPGYTDSVNNIRAIAELCTKLGNVERLDLLPYNPLGEPKYKKLGLKYALHGLDPPGREAMERLRQVARECGVRTVT